MYIVNNKKLMGFIIVVIAMLLTYTFLLQKSNNLPYVFDNNETYSSLIHAKNMDKYGVSETFGLTDESYATTNSGHPYVYTHQGNISRFYTLLLIKLGIESPESHIVISLLTIGLLGFYLAFRFLDKHISWSFSVIYCLLLMTDYILYAQWHMNTWRIWHLAFFFSSLLIAEKISQSSQKRWLFIGVLNFACLFYFEILFSLFVLLVTAIYTLFKNIKSIKNVIKIWVIQFVGTSLGFSVLALQSINYLGLDGFKKDLELTFFSRNRTGNNQEYIDSVIQFMDSNNIVFWHNFASQGNIKNSLEFIRETILYSLLLYTPLFLLISLIVMFFFVILVLKNIINNNKYEDVISFNYINEIKLFINKYYLSGLFLVVSLVIFSLFKDETFLGLNYIAPWYNILDSKSNLVLLIALPLVSYVVSNFVYANYATRTTANGKLLSLIFLLISAIFIHLMGVFFHSVFNPIYLDIASRTAPIFILRLYVLSIITLLFLQIISPLNNTNKNILCKIKNIFVYLGAGTIAYTITFYLLPGYVLTGYIYRQTPLFIFIYMAAFTAVIWCFLTILKQQYVNLIGDKYYKNIIASKLYIKEYFPLLLAIFSFGFTGFYWVNTQVYYINSIPPNNSVHLNLLRDKYQGKSFVVNTYAAPVSVMTDHWSYYDQGFEKNIIVNNKLQKPVLSDKRYLWFSDNETNIDYGKPEYFICIAPINMMSLMYRRIGSALQTSRGCSQMPIVNSVLKGTPENKKSLVDIDHSGKDSWAIIKLDYN